MDEKAQLEAMEKEKEQKIRHYMDLQDQADALNEAIYHVCCDIEILNRRIEQAKEAIRKAELKAVKGAAKSTPSDVA